MEDTFGIEISEMIYDADDGRWEDEAWVEAQAELSATEDQVGKVAL